MNREEIVQREVIDEMLQWPAAKLYNTFGPFLETVVNQQKERLQLKLKTIWRNRRWYAFNDTGEQFDSQSMLVYFDGKKIKSYSLHELEAIVEKIENETIYSNPRESKN